MRIPLILVALVVLVSACAKKSTPAVERRSGGRPSAGKPADSGTRKPAPNWAAMANKVPNLGSRCEEALGLLQDCVSEYDHYKRSVKAGSPDRARLKKAQRLLQEADDIDDMLREDIEEAAGGVDMSDTLMLKHRALNTYQRKWEKLAKKVRRKINLTLDK